MNHLQNKLARLARHRAALQRRLAALQPVSEQIAAALDQDDETAFFQALDDVAMAEIARSMYRSTLKQVNAAIEATAAAMR